MSIAAFTDFQNNESPIPQKLLLRGGVKQEKKIWKIDDDSDNSQMFEFWNILKIWPPPRIKLPMLQVSLKFRIFKIKKILMLADTLISTLKRHIWIEKRILGPNLSNHILHFWLRSKSNS